MVGSRLLIADDHPLVLQALTLAAESVIPDVAVDPASSIGEAERLAAARPGYRLVLLDLMLPDAHGFSGFLRLRHILGPVPIVIVTAQRRPALIEAARSLGAAGFLSKAQPLDELAAALRRVLSGDTAFPPEVGTSPRATRAHELVAQLSAAQRRVLLALADGRLNKQIANDLGLTEATVKAHLTAVFRKLKVDNRTQALLAVQPLFGKEYEEAP